MKHVKASTMQRRLAADYLDKVVQQIAQKSEPARKIVTTAGKVRRLRAQTTPPQAVIVAGA